ncbi:polyisoprenoid-binding protein YceI [Rhabdobacter roseus]|uniref:Polyisoprenoid-binding protein YceI n=1 Tax=Rhabdobacter roseus TaxID=1655419 RepID=A0A840TSR0_9BACT|nr:polyisoprenoid-binding protein YceI [Rhabdobacter roseus]
MKQLAGAMAAVMLLTSVVVAEDGTKAKAITFKVDPAKSTLKWNGKKVTGEHYGTINLKEGSFTLDGAKLIGGSFVADMTSLTVQDVTDKDMNGKLAGHLKSDDFFSVESHPTAKFVVTKATPKSAGQYDVTGDLTIKGITKPATFPVTVKTTANGAEATGTIVVDRSKYDMKFRSKSFFDANTLGDKLIYDDFTIDVKLVASK